jgi:predicted small lipoprotein YifL
MSCERGFARALGERDCNVVRFRAGNVVRVVRFRARNSDDVSLRRSRLSPTAVACLAVVALAALAGCGQKGPLVLPDGESAGSSTGAAGPPSSEDEEERAATGDRNGTESGTDGR